MVGRIGGPKLDIEITAKRQQMEQAKQNIVLELSIFELSIAAFRLVTPIGGLLVEFDNDIAVEMPSLNDDEVSIPTFVNH